MKKKTVVLLVFGLLNLILTHTYLLNNREDTGVYLPFHEENEEWLESEFKKLSLEEKINQLLFVETDNATFLSFTPGAISFNGNSFTDFIQLKKQFETDKENKPIFVNLSNDGLCHFSARKTDLNINHFFSNTDSSSIENLSSFILNLNLNLGIDFHSFSFVNLLPKFQYNIPLFNQLLTKTIKTTRASSQQHILNGFWCRFTIHNLEKDTIEYEQDIAFTKELIKNELPAIFLKQANSKLVKFIRENLNFRGLIIADFRETQKFDETEIIDLIDAGTSFFLLSENASIFKEKIHRLAKAKKLPLKEINKQVKNILLSKKWTEKAMDFKKENELCQQKKYKDLYRKFIENSITLVRNSDKLLPLKRIDKRLVVYNLGVKSSAFNSMLKKYTNFSYRNTNLGKAISSLKTINLILTINSENITEEELEKVKEILTKVSSKNKAIIVNFGSVKNLNYFDTLTTIVQAYGNSSLEQELVAQSLMGGASLKGNLPSFYKEKTLFPDTFFTEKNRLGFSTAEKVGLNTIQLKKIDSIAKVEIENGTFPGCQIFVAYKGLVVYSKSFGFHTYAKNQKVRNTDLYDLASLTKISATTLAAMKMYDLKKIDENTTLGDCIKNTKIDYTRIEPDTIIRIDTLLLSEIPNLAKLIALSDTINLNDSMIVSYDTIIAKLTPSRNIFKVKLSEMLVHESGVMPVLPLLPYLLYKIPHKRKNFRIKSKKYKEVNDSLRSENLYDTIYIEEKVLKRKEAFEKYFAKTKSDSSQMQIAKNMYFHNTYRDTLWLETKQLNVAKIKKYQYSDVNMILVQMAIDSLNGESLDQFTRENFYKELGMKQTCFLPLEHHSKKTIIPTSYDKIWRNQLLHGYVHDPSAAILGGIAGNAGLFSTAQDLGILFQMLLNKGTYGGKEYLSSKVIEQFTQRQKDCVRGLGFEIQSSKAIMSKYASDKTYGHTGFTGNCAWVDPENELVFVFLSNRVHPSSKNGKINSHKVRQKIHDAVYESIER